MNNYLGLYVLIALLPSISYAQSSTNSTNPNAGSQDSSIVLVTAIVVPVVAAVIGAAGIWSLVQARWNGHYFQKLILRELEEMSPNPRKKIDSNSTWIQHIPIRNFVHKKIFDNPGENRDYVLSIRPHLVYYVTQLWEEIRLLRESTNSDVRPLKPNSDQFLYYWEEIYKYCKSRSLIRKKYGRWKSIERTYEKWKDLIESYEGKKDFDSYLRKFMSG